MLGTLVALNVEGSNGKLVTVEYNNNIRGNHFSVTEIVM